ncbi:MAG TPA: type II toxin-antitoxin system death-on-curing family toxin [Herpetosiphonaceae bacterium]
MNYLLRDDILDLHTFAIERYGGRLGIKSQDKLLSAVNAPQQVLFGEEVYVDLASKAAVLGFQLLKNRPFVEGNEITALLAVLRFLDVNDVAVTEALAEAIASQLQAVQRSEANRDTLAAWLRDRLEVQVEE